jgi:OOP family OmpA-OmpF porin
MRFILFFLVLQFSSVYAQLNFLDGTWQGVITGFNQQKKDGKAIWFDFEIDATTGKFKGDSRIETPFTAYYVYKLIKGTATSRNTIEFEDSFIGSQKNTGANVWCMNKGSLTYNDSTGYLKGTWIAKDCRGQSGEILLYRSKHALSKTDSLSLYHSWFNTLIGDLERGWNAYYVRESEMRDFEFIPVYFDHDMDVVKTEFHVYLKRMTQIVMGHTDLRIKIIGHTDSNGEDTYNIDLSARRAKNVKDFLILQGVPADRIVIEFRGEKDPVSSNLTPDGKRKNRRVDFEFI